MFPLEVPFLFVKSRSFLNQTPIGTWDMSRALRAFIEISHVLLWTELFFFIDLIYEVHFVLGPIYAIELFLFSRTCPILAQSDTFGTRPSVFEHLHVRVSTAASVHAPGTLPHALADEFTDALSLALLCRSPLFV